MPAGGDEEVALTMSDLQRLLEAEADIEPQQLSDETAFILSKAAELFMDQLSTKAQQHMAKEGREEMSYRDVANAVKTWEAVVDILRDVVPQPVKVSELMKLPAYQQQQ